MQKKMAREAGPEPALRSYVVSWRKRDYYRAAPWLVVCPLPRGGIECPRFY